MDQNVEKIEQALEVDVRRLAEEVKDHRERPELQGAGDREIVRHAIQSMTHDDDNKSAPAQPAIASGNVIQNPLPDYAANAPAETKLEIEYLLELAFHKGILAASGEAKKSSPFVRDAFHDALIGKLYQILKQRGIVK
ncbi:MAG: hypothetical protein V1489_02985 [Candidatus Liptonbacteria bacterium]